MPIDRRAGYWLWTNGPVPRGSAGITLGNVIIVRRSTVPARLLRHELVHVRQFGEMGVVHFLVKYLAHYFRWRLRGYPHRGAYRRIPLEIEAYWLERQGSGEESRPAPVA